MNLETKCSKFSGLHPINISVDSNTKSNSKKKSKCLLNRFGLFSPLEPLVVKQYSEI